MAIRIFIDQGHNPVGYHNSGAEGNGIYESDINYMVGRYLADLLTADPRFEVRTSRNSPTEVLGTDNLSSLTERVTMANEWPANYFISIHTNASENPNQNGSEVYVASQYSEAYWLGDAVLREIVRRLGMQNNGVLLNPSLFVLRRTNMPSILVELGYITNSSDAWKLANQQYAFAYAIYSGLLNYFGLSPL
ncbi:N-acetylmuramoyl-L-alanine amidase family protein [Konateibacter massiliensis]|uniref:N-acetylmuramoyl-L-alanine amidase family protein n=1 Tax=Konateibacter massiliensis TaxID=2002841 RepID=UPI000C14C92D|nr:N-acetylmuramoyl-L-alanine amidase [Konateibacter massiliensis]